MRGDFLWDSQTEPEVQHQILRLYYLTDVSFCFIFSHYDVSVTFMGRTLAWQTHLKT